MVFLVTLQTFVPLLLPAQATTSQLEFRIRNLESQVSRLRGEINRVRSQASGGVTRVEVVPPPNVPELPSDVPPDASSRLMLGDPVFDRLATLVIELKQDVQDLQQRLAELEQD
ncbi:MAG: hypothetical protein ACFBSC_16635 [Microcoleaceae cyanobacterium]